MYPVTCISKLYLRLGNINATYVILAILVNYFLITKPMHLNC